MQSKYKEKKGNDKHQIQYSGYPGVHSMQLIKRASIISLLLHCTKSSSWDPVYLFMPY